jgi:hypothetical protein
VLSSNDLPTTAELRALVADSLAMSERAVRALADHAGQHPHADPGPLQEEKVVGEALLLLRATAATLEDHEVSEPWESLYDAVSVLARPAELAASLVLDPERALEHAFAHIQLSALGNTDAAIDGLLDLALGEPTCGPEPSVVPELQRQWLLGLRRGRPVLQGRDRLLARSSLGRPVDVLRCSTQDVYDLTHAVMHGCDLGSWALPLPRPSDELTRDLDALLGLALDADNFDLTAELLWSWPMLRLPWTPTARFAFGVITQARRRHGFLPGPGFDPRRHSALGPAPAADYVLRTSYHANLVFGILCAAVLVAPPGQPPVATADHKIAGSGARMLDLVDTHPRRRWRDAALTLREDDADELAPMFLTVALRRFSDRADLSGIGTALELAVELDLADGQAVFQATKLLRRGTAMVGLLHE